MSIFDFMALSKMIKRKLKNKKPLDEKEIRKCLALIKQRSMADFFIFLNRMEDTPFTYFCDYFTSREIGRIIFKGRVIEATKDLIKVNTEVVKGKKIYPCGFPSYRVAYKDFKDTIQAIVKE